MKGTVAFACMFLLIVLLMGRAEAHELECSSVGGDRVLTLEDKTVYDDVLAESVSRWNAATSRVSLRVVESGGDVLVTDSNLGRDGGRYLCSGLIELDRGWMVGTQFKWRVQALVHEEGHALGLAHPPTTRYWEKRSIMHPRPLVFYPKRHDKRDLNRMWG
jgi:hypothetical protein